MNKPIKWIVGASVLVVAPLVAPASASAGIGACTGGPLLYPPTEYADWAVGAAGCSAAAVGSCTGDYDPVDPANAASETVTYAGCVLL